MASHAGSADLVLVGGPVMTMDPSHPTAEAVAVGDGRLVAVGSAREAIELAGRRTRRIDLRGRTLLPGFVDAHCHPAHASVHLRQCSLDEVPPSASAYVAAIRAYANANPRLDWVLGSGWAMAAFPGGTPSRHDLDLAVPDRPGWFANRDGHGGWANSRALAIAGITRDSTDPPDGRIERDADGEPSGTLHEGAMDLVERLLPEPSVDDLADGLGLAQA